MSKWRYILQSVPDGEFIDLDVPLTNVSVTKSISSPGSITGTIPVVYAALRKSNNELAIQEWGTVLHIEEDGEILQSGIIDALEIDGQSLTIQAGGFSMLPTDLPWTGKDRNYISADPLDVLRDIWAHIESFKNGGLGVTVDPLKSNKRVGIPETPTYTKAVAAEKNAQARYVNEQQRATVLTAAVDLAKKTLFQACKVSPVGQVILSASAPSGNKKVRGNLWLESDQDNAPAHIPKTDWVKITRNTVIDARIADYLMATKRATEHKTVLSAAKTLASNTTTARKDLSDEQAVPLTLAWWQTDNLATVINDLVDDTGFEYAEHSYWSGDTIKHQLKLGTPLGGRKNDLRFEIGVNVTSSPRISLDDYASEVLMFGAGEGSSRIRGHITAPTNRLRRVAVRTDQGITSKARAENAARPLLRDFSGDRSIDALTVNDHPLAPLGTFLPGDQIRVTGNAGWAQDIDMWVRIEELTSTPDSNTIELKVRSL